MKFWTNSLLSKWGFCDGNILSDMLFDNKIKVHRHEVLIEVVKKYIIPVIEEDVELKIICTHHNPIRAKSVNGKPINVTTNDNGVTLHPEFIEVDDGKILDIANNLSEPIEQNNLIDGVK